jgi:MFS family permease
MRFPWRLDPELPHTFYVLLVGRLFNMVGNSLVFPFLSVFLASRLGGSMMLAGMALAGYGVVQVASVLVGGILADAWGRRRVLLLSLGGGAVSAYLVGSVHPLWALLVTLPMMGFLLPLFQPASMALTADLVPPHKLNEAYALLRMASNAGIIVGPMLGGFLANISYFWLFFCDTVTLLGFFALVWRAIPETLTGRGLGARDSLSGLVTVARDRRFVGFALLWALTGLVYSQLYMVVPAYLHLSLGYPPGVFGYLAAENAVLVVLLQVPLTRAMRTLPRQVPMVLGLVCYAFGFLLMAHGRALWIFGAAVLVITIGENLVNPAASAWVAERADITLRGRYLGAFSLASRLGSAAGPLVGGTLLTWGSGLWLGAVAAIATITAAGYSRVRDPAPDAWRHTASGRPVE